MFLDHAGQRRFLNLFEKAVQEYCRRGDVKYSEVRDLKSVSMVLRAEITSLQEVLSNVIESGGFMDLEDRKQALKLLGRKE